MLFLYTITDVTFRSTAILPVYGNGLGYFIFIKQYVLFYLDTCSSLILIVDNRGNGVIMHLTQFSV